MIRKIHRWLALLTALPFLVIVGTGCLLQIKGWISAIQPPKQQSTVGSMSKITHLSSWPILLHTLREVPEAKIENWDDLNTIDIRPGLGVARARNKSGYEVQLDLATGKVLSHGMRYTSWLIEIHEGAVFGKLIKNTVFVPVSFLLFFISITGFSLLSNYYRQTWRRLWSR